MNDQESSQSYLTNETQDMESRGLGIPFAPSHFSSDIGWTTKKRKKKRKKKKQIKSNPSKYPYSSLKSHTLSPSPSQSPSSSSSPSPSPSKLPIPIPMSSTIQESSALSEELSPNEKKPYPQTKVKNVSSSKRRHICTKNDMNVLLSTYGGGYTIEEHQSSHKKHLQEVQEFCNSMNNLQPSQTNESTSIHVPSSSSSSSLSLSVNINGSNYNPATQNHIGMTTFQLEQKFENNINFSILTLKPKDKVTIVGIAKIHVLKGMIDLFGYTLKANDTQIPFIKDEINNHSCSNDFVIYSPSWMSTITIQNKSETEICKIRLSTINTTAPLSSNQISPNIQQTMNDSQSFEIMDTLFNQNKAFPITIPKPWCDAVDSICSSIYQKPNIPPFSSNLNDLSNQSQPSNQDTSILQTRVLICGATHVGKSTCLRYVINRILSNDNEHHKRENTSHSKQKGVVVLDCDLGQPEFNPPGILSLTHVCEPIFSPPHIHIIYPGKTNMNATFHTTSKAPSSAKTTDIPTIDINASRNIDSYYFGDTSSKSDPIAYTNMINQLMNSYEQQVIQPAQKSYPSLVNQLSTSERTNDAQHITIDTCNSKSLSQDKPSPIQSQSSSSSSPLIVNTDGWVKGMGNEILGAIIDIVKPTHIIQILGHSKAKCFDLPPSIPDDCKVHVVETFQRGQNQLIETSYVHEHSSFNHPKIANNAGHAKSADLRALRFCTYFLGGMPECNHIPNVRFTSSGFIDPNGYIASSICEKKPYAISFDDIHYFLKSDEADIKDYLNEYEKETLILDGLNASFVALCTLNSNQSLMNQQDLNPRCHGLGIIRSIDRKRRLFYILTPLSMKTLQSVDLIIGGGKIPLPFEFFSRNAPGTCSSFPYQCYDGLMSNIIGSDVIKSRGQGDTI